MGILNREEQELIRKIIGFALPLCQQPQYQLTGEKVDLLAEGLKRVLKKILKLENQDVTMRPLPPAPKPGTHRFVREQLETIFDSFISTLGNCGCPEPWLIALTVQRELVITKTLPMEFVDGHLPFVPVIPRDRLDLNKQMAMIRQEGDTGKTLLTPSLLTDRYEDLPTAPYFMIDVETAGETEELPPETAAGVINRNKQLGATTEEIIALAILTESLASHGLWAVGSCYESDVPCLELFSAGKPRLLHHSPFAVRKHCLAPSCASRFSV